MVGGRRRVAGGGRRSLEGSRYHPRGRDIIDTFPPLFAHRFPPVSPSVATSSSPAISASQWRELWRHFSTDEDVVG